MMRRRGRWRHGGQLRIRRRSSCRGSSFSREPFPARRFTAATAAGVGLDTMKTTSIAAIAACALLDGCQQVPQPETTPDAAGNTLVEWPLPAGAGAAQPDMSLAPDGRLPIGRESCRDRVWQYVEISVVAGSLQQ